MIQAIIVLEWLFIILGALVFLLMYGRPWRKRDVTMAWHLSSVTAVALLEIVGLMLTGISLVPSAIAYGVSVGIIYWRIALLLHTRRRKGKG